MESSSIHPDTVMATNRSLVIIHANINSDSEFRERAGRLVESLNNADTMKAVVVTVNGGLLYPGFTITKENTEPEPDLTNLKSKFVQVIEVRNGHN